MIYASIVNYISKSIQTYCRKRGLRGNLAREVIADTLQGMCCNATCDEIWLKLINEGFEVSVSTVYIQLRWLRKYGFVKRVAGERQRVEYFIVNE